MTSQSQMTSPTMDLMNLRFELLHMGRYMFGTKEYRMQLRNELQSQHEKFAQEIILRLKYFYRLHEEKPYPKSFSFVNLNICDAIFALSYLFRSHYKKVFYALHDELVDLEEYEKFCFSIPVPRGRRYTFNFLFRISFIFELTMYLFKKGYDYFDIARRCFAEYPDLLYFYKAGGWPRVNQVADFIIYITKVLEVDITVEHPLLGDFIEIDQDIHDDEFTIPQLIHQRLKIEEMIADDKLPTGEDDFFDSKNMETLKYLYYHFVAPKSSKTKCCNVCNLSKISETFPLYDRVPFTINDELETESYITYDLYDERREIHMYFRSFMSPEILERYFPLKVSPDSPDEDAEEEVNSVPVRECYMSDFSDDDASSRSYSPQLLTPEELQAVEDSIYEEEIHKTFDNYVSNDVADIFTSNFANECSEKSREILYTSSNIDPAEYIDMAKEGFYERIKPYMQKYGIKDDDDPEVTLAMIKEISNILPRPMSYSGSENVTNEEVILLPRSISSIVELPRSIKHMLVKLIIDIQRLPREKKEIVMKVLPVMNAFLCIELNFLTKIIMSVPYSEDHEASDLINGLKNVWYVSEDTKYLLFKIIMHCRDLTIQEREELFCILVNIPDNTTDMKLRFIEAIYNMRGIGDRIQSDLIQCVIDFTDEECMDIHRSAGKINFLEDFEGKFSNEDQLRKEFEKISIIYKKDYEYDLDKLQNVTCTTVQTEYSPTFVGENAGARQLTPSTRAILQTLREEGNMALNKELESLSETSKVPQQSPNRHYYKKPTRKSRKRSKK